MRYANLRELDKALERRVDRNVKHYKSDWSKYDRHKYNRMKESPNRNERQLILIVRECGTLLFTLRELEVNDTAKVYYNYYKDGNRRYKIDIDDLSIVIER